MTHIHVQTKSYIYTYEIGRCGDVVIVKLDWWTNIVYFCLFFQNKNEQSAVSVSLGEKQQQ